ncbi:MAG TPA: CHAT domain-containing tetratricopeptide repeat protein [Steroidobacteraceae bacterium]|nr:CHAT domain-containing tetratricopeptide repeat protein [Steroidobacteraceae bacterium]
MTCTAKQRAQVSDGKPWRCQVDLQANHAYLAEVSRQSRDVTLEILASDARRVVKVDSPTVRAGPELLFFTPQSTGHYTLIVSPVERGLPARTLDISWREVAEASPGSELARGLGDLTTAGVVSDTRRPDEAQRQLASLEAARTHLRAAHADALEAEALLRTANLYFWTLGDWTHAAASASLSAKAFAKVSQPIMTSQAEVLRAESLIEGAGETQAARSAPKSGRTPFDEAEQVLAECAQRFAAAGMTYDQALALNYQGVSAHYQGRLAAARAHYENAARIFAAIGESASEVQSLQNIAVIDFQRGDYVEAVSAYKRLLAKLDPSSNRRTYVAIANNLAVAEYALGQADEALKSLLATLPLTEGSAEAADRARTWHLLGRIYLTLGEQERGEVFLQQALELRESNAVQDRQGLLASLVEVADLKRENGEPQLALKLHLQALDHAVSPQEKGRALLAIGQDQIATGAGRAAAETLARGLKLDLPAQSTVRYRLSGAYGYALSRSGDPAGRELLLKAARAHEATGDDNYAAENYVLLAGEERRAGEIGPALRYVGKALSLYDLQRIRAVNPDLRATYISNRAAAYELQADLYMERWQKAASRADQDRLAASALGAAERLRTLALEDFRQFAQQPGRQPGTAPSALAELDARLAAKRHRLATLLDLDAPPAGQVASLRREIALLRTQIDVAQQKQAPTGEKSARTAAVLSLPQLQASLASGSAVITWLLGEERSWIWCITPDSATAFALGSGKSVEAAARDLYALWSQPPDGSDTREREVKASRTILGAAGPIVAKQRAVTIVADGTLRTIPFAAVWLDGQPTAKRLADFATVSYQPALDHWQGVNGKQPGTEPGERILLVGDPVIIGSPDAGVAQTRDAVLADGAFPLRRLPASRREVEGIVKIASGWHSDVLLGEAATKTAVLAQPLSAFRVLHFATHARLDVHDPQLSSILLSTRAQDSVQDDSALSLRDIVGLGLNADAVVLSACEGSLGKEYRGQLSFGLSEAFLLAGARNVLGSLWRVSDVATETYMRVFYQAYMTRGMDSVAAAQTAARRMKSDPVYGHPYYWAAFVILAS